MANDEARRRIAEICATRRDYGFITLDDNLLASDLRALLAEGTRPANNDSSDARKRLAVLLDRLDGIRACGTIEQTAEWDNDAAQFLADHGRALLAEGTKPVDAEFQRNFRDPPDPLAESVPAGDPVAVIDECVDGYGVTRRFLVWADHPPRGLGWKRTNLYAAPDSGQEEER